MTPNLKQMIVAAALAVAPLVAWGGVAQGQQPTPRRPEPRAQQPRRQETIEIRGQVPTPQVVTVRPREAPAYSRRVLVPAFLDHDFWPSILPPIQLVTPPAPLRADSASRTPADSAVRPTPPARAPPGTPPALRRR